MRQYGHCKCERTYVGSRRGRTGDNSGHEDDNDYNDVMTTPAARHRHRKVEYVHERRPHPVTGDRRHTDARRDRSKECHRHSVLSRCSALVTRD